MTSVIRLNAALHRHGALLEQIWEGAVSTITDENSRAITELKALQVIISDDEGNVRLSRTYRELLNRSIGRKGNYTSSRSISDDIDRLRAVAVEADTASRAQDDATYYEAIREGSDIIWELSDTLEIATRDYEQLLHNGLGKTGSREARIRRTEYAITKLKGLNQSVAFLVDGPARDVLSQPSCSDLRRLLARRIEDSLHFIIQRITRTANELSKMLLTDKEVLARTRRDRAMLRLLKSVSIEDRVIALQIHDDHAANPCFEFSLRIDPNDDELDDLRESLARSMKPAQKRKPRIVERAGELVGNLIVDKPVEEAMDAILSEAFEGELGAGPAISLREWLSSRDVTESEHAFESIMTGILSEPEVFKVEFVPPLAGHMSSRIHDIRVRLAA